MNRDLLDRDMIEQWAASHETDERVVYAIFCVANGDPARAQRLWESCSDAEFLAIYEVATNNGMLDAHDMYWGGETLGNYYDQL